MSSVCLPCQREGDRRRRWRDSLHKSKRNPPVTLRVTAPFDKGAFPYTLLLILYFLFQFFAFVSK